MKFQVPNDYLKTQARLIKKISKFDAQNYIYLKLTSREPKSISLQRNFTKYFAFSIIDCIMVFKITGYER